MAITTKNLSKFHENLNKLNIICKTSQDLKKRLREHHGRRYDGLHGAEKTSPCPNSATLLDLVATMLTIEVQTVDGKKVSIKEIPCSKVLSFSSGFIYRSYFHTQRSHRARYIFWKSPQSGEKGHST
eukprot:2647850-Rhodomonas_salina.3